MEMFCFGLMGGMILAVIFIAGGAVYAKGNTERTNDVDSDIRVYVPSRDRDRNSVKRSDESMAEKAVMVLQNFRVGACGFETGVIDWMIEQFEEDEEYPLGRNDWQE